ncbi:MAG: hypothetical protein ACJ8F7_19935 [Gemmataceae bacterium]
MRRLLLCALVLGLGATRAAAQDDPKDIIKKAIAAHGGAEKIDKYKAFKSHSKGTVTVLGMEAEFTNDTTFQAPDKFKSTIKLEIMGNSVTVEQRIVGDKVTRIANGMAQDLPEEAKAELKSSLGMQRILSLTPLLSEKGYQLKALGASKVDGMDVIGVEVSGNGVKDMKVYFDKTSYLITKIERKGLDPVGQTEAKQEILVSDYKEFNGVKRPTKTVLMVDGKKFMESVATETTLLEKVDDKEFSD